MQDLFSLVKEHRCVRKLLTEENKHIDAASNKDTNSQTNQVYMKQKPSHPALTIHTTNIIANVCSMCPSAACNSPTTANQLSSMFADYKGPIPRNKYLSYINC